MSIEQYLFKRGQITYPNTGCWKSKEQVTTYPIPGGWAMWWRCSACYRWHMKEILVDQKLGILTDNRL